MKEQLSALAITTLQALSPVILALLGLVAMKLHALIDARVKNEKARGVLDRLDDAALTVVREVEQTVVSRLDPTKPLPDNGKAARDAALASLKSHLGQKGIDEIKNVLGVGDSGIESILVSYIESKVHIVNQEKPMALEVAPLKTAGGAA